MMKPLISFVLMPCVLGAGLYAFLPGVRGQERTTNPHGTIQIPCQDCHTPEGWKPMRSATDFDHQKKTKFPLRGMHVRVSCMECHVDLAFARAGSECADCHADIHRRQLGADCEQCHTVHGWREVVKGVNQHTNRFPLIGAHALTGCESCHKGAAVGLFRGLNTDCAFCHIEDFRNARTVNHVEAGFSTRCENCHGADLWRAAFDHAAVTGFALVGVHTSLDCLQCHAGGRFAGTPAACVGCHLEDFNSTTSPNHVTARISQECSICHSAVAWTPAIFNHNTTKFPLTGAHIGVDCTNCHAGGVFTGTPTDCASCHLKEFNAATNPNHVTARFPQVCSVCHNAVAWTPSIFNHSATRFPLTGAHVGVDCTSCHIGGVFAGTPTVCNSCHSGDFTTITDPNHVAAGFSRDCATCHTTTTWNGARYNQHRFPIYTGAHAGEWASCNSDCHTNSSNYAVFYCLAPCHGQAQTNSNHTGVSGYVYNSTNCYACHPTGRGD